MFNNGVSHKYTESKLQDSTNLGIKSHLILNLNFYSFVSFISLTL